MIPARPGLAVVVRHDQDFDELLSIHAPAVIRSRVPIGVPSVSQARIDDPSFRWRRAEIVDDHPEIVSLIPADGWEVEWLDGELGSPLVAWGVTSSGGVVGLVVDADGRVEPLRTPAGRPVRTAEIEAG